MIGGGAGTRGCEATDYPRKASACEGQEFGRAEAPLYSPPPHSAALVPQHSKVAHFPHQK